MDETLRFILHHGYLVLLVWVFAEQMGLPVPSMPGTLAAGALAGTGKLKLGLVVLLPSIGALLADVIWYELGKYRGAKVLNLLCRISLEPDSCIRNTENRFARSGAGALVIAKFVPGLSTAAPPLAGMFGMRFTRFLIYDGAGAVVYNGAFVILGYAFSRQLEKVAQVALQLGAGLLVLAAGGLFLYIAWKYFQRQKFLRTLRVNRITPEELKRKIDAGEEVTIIDLRHSMDFEADPSTIPGAYTLPSEEFEKRYREIPADRELILYCT
ncbi:MAG: sulfurtransferase [Acidobacteria bacterium]|nr:MAG: sulfurtransferase [Acidobacteriota bacterium]